MKRRDSRKCLNCRRVFEPDHRNRRHQRYCSAPACRAASKAASQRRWLSKPENRDYFRGPANVQRVRAWREAHPGQVRRGRALQDVLPSQAVDKKEESGIFPALALQDDWRLQALDLTGLIAHLTGSRLQEDIDRTRRRYRQLAIDILFGTQGERHAQTPVTPGAGTPDPGTVQLGRSPPGP